MDLEQILRHENEHTNLDFKKSQYCKEQFDSLIKDLIAMANSDSIGPRHIIVGVKHYPGGERKFFPINRENFIDDATYQQLIFENVEPKLSFRYEPLQLAEGLFGVFNIDAHLDQPYIMKRDRGILRRGDSWVRIGSSQQRLTRSDLDRIYSQKTSSIYNGGSLILLKTTFEKELQWAANANSGGAYFSVIVDYGQEFGELTSQRRLDLLEWARTVSEDMGLDVTDPYENSGTDFIEFWTPQSPYSDFRMRFTEPGVVWLQFRYDADQIELMWLIEKYRQLKNLLHNAPYISNIKEKRLGMSLANWPKFGIDLKPYFDGYRSLNHGKLRGASLINKTKADVEPNWEHFFKDTLKQSLTERGYIGHEYTIETLQL